MSKSKYDKLTETLKENLSHNADFHDVVINEFGWVVTKFTQIGNHVSFKLSVATDKEIENLRKKYSLTVQEDYSNGNKTFRMVRGNNIQECLNNYFELINYIPSLKIKREFDSIELLEKEACWSKSTEGNIYTAIKDNASIFITYDHGEYQRLSFKKDQGFKIEHDFIIFDKTTVDELPV